MSSFQSFSNDVSKYKDSLITNSKLGLARLDSKFLIVASDTPISSATLCWVTAFNFLAARSPLLPWIVNVVYVINISR